MVQGRQTLAPDSGYAVQSLDSTFIFGSVGRGDARVAVNGQDAMVFTTGGWLAWVPLPDDSLAVFSIVATAGPDTVRAVLTVPIAGWTAPSSGTAWIDPDGLMPAGDRWVRPGEGYRLGVRAAPGSVVRAVFPNGDTLDFQPDHAVGTRPWGEDAFSTTRIRVATPATDRYAAWRVGGFGPDPGDVLAPSHRPADDDEGWVWVESILGIDTARISWPLRVGAIQTPPPLAVIDDDTAGTGATDRVLPGRPVPHGTYHWFFPNGTAIPVSGRANDQVRLQLSRRAVAWVDASGVRQSSDETTPSLGVVRSMRLFPETESVTLRVPMTRRMPFRVSETEQSLILRIYGAAADMDWIQYGGTDPLVRLVSFDQPSEDEVEITVDLAEMVWGYRTRWDGTDLLLEIRRPPRIDLRHPLRGRRIAIDAGHPPGGATGPIGLTEAEATLAVSRKLQALLEDRGAEVIMTRNGPSEVGLIERTEAAVRADAELLVSVHANALPDGVNPFANNGTSVYYNHPRSVEFARMVDRALVQRLGLRDLGIGRGDLHMVRPTWMPAVLAEGLFMMIPEQEAVLASEDGQRRYALGLMEGIEAFLRWRSGRQPSRD